MQGNKILEAISCFKEHKKDLSGKWGGETEKCVCFSSTHSFLTRVFPFFSAVSLFLCCLFSDACCVRRPRNRCHRAQLERRRNDERRRDGFTLFCGPPPPLLSHATQSKPCHYPCTQIHTEKTVVHPQCSAPGPTWYVETGEAAMKGVMEVCAIIRLVAML